jgi:YHS domain-containing protein
MLLRFIVSIILIYLAYKVVRMIMQPKETRKNKSKFTVQPRKSENLVEDPVCHKYIPLSQAYIKEIAGQNHYFCSKECCEKYIAEKSKETHQGGL